MHFPCQTFFLEIKFLAWFLLLHTACQTIFNKSTNGYCISDFDPYNECMTNAIQSPKHDLRSKSGTRAGKYKSRTCGQCGGKNTVLIVDADYKGCECKDCGFSTDLSS